ncbi:hypothetical protein SCACP_34530 [Sporomusa carbonis]
MKKLEVVLLGKPVVCWQGKRITFPFTKLEGLFYYLVLTKQATRDELAALLWSDTDDTTAKKNLRNAVYLLKKLIAEEFLLTPGRNIILVNPEFALEIDTDMFLASEGPDSKNGIELYRGEFMEGFALKDAEEFEAWILRQRESFRELYINRVKKLVVTLLDSKQYSQAKHYLKQLIQVDEYNETSYRTLMQLYERERAFNKALEVYRNLKNKLAKELGIKPDAATTDLYNRIQQRKMDSALPAGSSQPPGEVFFGRERQLTILKNRIRQFQKTDKSSLIVVVGEQGVGKTALVRQLVSSINLDGILLFEAQCYQAEEKYPFKPWNGVFRKIAQILEEQQVKLPALWQHIVSYIFPVVADSSVFSSPDPVLNLDLMNYNVAQEVICGILSKVTGNKKTIILVEDIQWIDPNSFMLIKQLLLNNPGKFLVIATCRNEPEYQKKFNAAVAPLERQGLLLRVPVDRFTCEEVAEFSTLRLPPDKVTPQLLRSLYEYTEGNALFLVEYFNLLQEGRNIDIISSRIQSILRDRVSVVSEKGRLILNIASVFFDEVNSKQVLSLCGLSELELVEALEELQEKNLLVEVVDPKSDKIAYRFYHGKIRDFVYSQLSLARRRVLHDKIGMMMEAELKNDFRDRALYSALLYHFSHSGNKLKVLEYTIKIAEGYSYVSHELFPHISDNYLYAGGNLCMGQHQAAKYLQEVGGIIDGIKETEGTSDRLSYFEAAYLDMLGRYYICQDEHRKGIHIIHSMIDLAAGIGDYEYVAKGYQQIVYYGIRNNKAPIIEKFAKKIIDIARKYSLKEKLATALRFLGVAYAIKLEYAQAEEYYRKSIALFKKIEDNRNNYTLSIAAAYNYIGDLRRFEKKFGEAIEYYEQAIELCLKKNIYKGLALFYTNAGHAAFEMSEYGNAEHYLTEAVKMYEWLGVRWGYATLNSLLALLAVKNGRMYEALEKLQTADDCVARLKDIGQRGMVLRAKAEIRSVMEIDRQARQVFAEYLPLSVEEYCRQGREVFAKLGDCYEINILDNISNKNLQQL